MKNTKQILVLSIVLLVISHPSYAQLRNIKNKIQNRVEQEIRQKQEEKIDEYIDKGIDAIKESTKEEKSEVIPSSQRTAATMLFQQRTYKKNGKVDQNIHYNYYFSHTGELMVMDLEKNKQSSILFLYDKNAHYMLDNESNTAMRVPLRSIQKWLMNTGSKYIEELEEGTSQGKWTSSGKTANINGYNCSEYIYTEGKDKMILWIASNVYKQVPQFHLMLPATIDFSKVDTPADLPVKWTPNSAVIKSEFYENGIKLHDYELKSYSDKVDQKLFDLSKYEVMDMLNKF